MSSADFLIELITFLTLSFMSSLYTLHINPFSDISFANIYSLELEFTGSGKERGKERVLKSPLEAQGKLEEPLIQAEWSVVSLLQSALAGSPTKIFCN